MANDYIIINGELYHHGVKGMKWGVRRKRKTALVPVSSTTRNYGTGTPQTKKTKKVRDADTDSKKLRVAAAGSKMASNTADTIATGIRKYDSDSAKAKARSTDLSKMSDAQLREKVNRYNMEKQYRNMVAEEQTGVNRGRMNAAQAIEVVGSVLAAGATALSLAVMIKDLKKK